MEANFGVSSSQLQHLVMKLAQIRLWLWLPLLLLTYLAVVHAEEPESAEPVTLTWKHFDGVMCQEDDYSRALAEYYLDGNPDPANGTKKIDNSQLSVFPQICLRLVPFRSVIRFHNQGVTKMYSSPVKVKSISSACSLHCSAIGRREFCAGWGGEYSPVKL